MAKRIVDEEMRFSIVINGDPAQKELHEIDKATKELTSTNRKLRTEKARLERQNKTETARYKEVTAELNKNTKAIQANNARQNQLEKQIGVTGLTMSQLQKRAAALRLALKHSVPGDVGTKRLQAELKEVSLQMRKVRAESTGMRMSIGKVADGFNRFAALGASAIAAITGVVFSIQKFIDFNSQLSDAQANVQKTTGLTKTEVDELTKSFGALQTRSSRMELLKLAEEAGRLGIKGVKDIKAFTEIANEMNVALGDELSPEQIREVGKATNIFKVGQKNGLGFAKAMQSLGSSINEVAASGANSAEFLVDFLKRTAGIGDIANISAQDIVGLAATFDELGQSQEVSATAVNKTLISMGQNVEKFANVAGFSVEEFSKLLEEDANEALIKFLEGLNANNPSLETMAKRLEGIEVGGTRGVQALSALAGNVDLLRQRQELANDALEKNVSLTNEYNLKNQNFAAIVERIQKALNGFLAGAKAPLEALIRGFADLFGIVDDANEAFAKQNEATFEAAQNNRILASESQNLLDRYEELTKDGLIPTTEKKAELERISLKLRDRLGESVFMINEETGAFEVNTDAVREQIKIKRLAADEEAATLASRSQGLKDAIKTKEQELKLAQKEARLRLEEFKAQNPDAGRSALASGSQRINANIDQFSNLPGQKELQQARDRVNALSQDLIEKIENRKELIKQLEALNFSESDIDEFFKVPEITEDQPQEGDTKTIGLTTLRYTNGKWTVVPPKVDDTTSSTFASKTADIFRTATDAQLQALEDGIQKELAIEDERHRRIIQELEERLLEEKNLTEQERKAIYDNINAQETIHQRNRASIIDQGFEQYIDKQLSNYDREAAIRYEAHLQELTQLGDNQKAKEQKIEQFKRSEKELEKQHIEEVEAMLRQMLDSMNFKGFDLNMLSDEQIADFRAKLTELGIAAKEIEQILQSIQGKGNKESFAAEQGSTDILGFSSDQWIQTFEHLDTTRGKLEALGMAVGAAANLYSMFTQNRIQDERREYDLFMANQEDKRTALENRLNNGLINERQYRNELDALNKEQEKRKAKLEYKEAERQHEITLGQTISNVAMSISRVAWNPVLTGIVSALGALQIASVIANKPKMKGYEDGFYGSTFPVEREQDGKIFNARFGGMTRSGVVSSPTVYLAGETAPEMIISGKDYANFAPDFKASLGREIARVKGFEEGFMPQSSKAQNDITNTELIALLKANKALLAILIDEGITANVIANERNARELQEALDKYRKRKQSAQI